MKLDYLYKNLLSISIFGFMSFLAVGSSNSSNVDSSVPKSQEEIRIDQLAKYFNTWDGSHIGLTEYIKKSMNDPNSYEHVETKYIDNGDYLTVTAKFRGKNAFGGVVTNSITAKVNLTGKVLEVISQEP